jgi:hypothetical protein
VTAPRYFPAARPNYQPKPAALHQGFKMNGLRMYSRSAGPEQLSVAAIFYSRRGDGPYYQWSFEAKAGQWRGSRVRVADFAPRELTMANWKNIPAALQAKLGEHYMD